MGSELHIPGDRFVVINPGGSRSPLSSADDRRDLASQLRDYDVQAVSIGPFSVAFTGSDTNRPSRVGMAGIHGGMGALLGWRRENCAHGTRRLTGARPNAKPHRRWTCGPLYLDTGARPNAQPPLSQ
ncbi:hypothetical protein GCM10023168_21580 [Fodinibacter luteus]|uniref:DAGKc domain-containing protein n=1 Tax=Fodinibacter luteus TaxID=552064 RepID=A0ABP8KH65_9MICO